MKILFLTSTGCDNLEDGMLHGFRSLYGADVVDFPKKEVMYKGIPIKEPEKKYGKLFTIWRNLPDIPVDRMDIEDRVKRKDFDLVIFGSIWRTQPWFKALKKWLTPKNTFMIDGEDTARIHPSARKFMYFKREFLPKSSYYYRYKLIPPMVYNRVWLLPQTVQPISFAIPKEKITWGIDRKNKKTLLPQHIVDKEVLEYPAFKRETDGNTGHVFDREEDYYKNLQEAKFGVTIKRAGWDCLRHYEIAANGSVQCFRDLELKHPNCAPHELVGGVNCLTYHHPNDLAEKIDKLSDEHYDTMLAKSYEWVARQTTEFRADDVLKRFFDLSKK